MRRLILQGLLKGPATVAAPRPSAAAVEELAANVDRSARSVLGRSLAIRHVDAGSCNGCELELHALNNAVYDLERFGMRFVASPRHADVLLVTGPVTTNMRKALERTHAAMPGPKWVVAVGDCGVDGGLFKDSYAVVGGVSAAVPVDLHIRGCPPTPMQLLEGLLALFEPVDHLPIPSSQPIPAAPEEVSAEAAEGEAEAEEEALVDEVEETAESPADPELSQPKAETPQEAAVETPEKPKEEAPGEPNAEASSDSASIRKGE
jgi:Ni,Fe-hydrogenase III small subunit